MSSPEDGPARQRIVKLLDGAPAAEATDDTDDADHRYYELRDVFAQLAEGELRELQSSLRWRRTQPGSLTPLSVKLTIAAIRLRLGYIERTLAGPQPGAAATLASAPGWEARPAIARRRAGRVFRTWTEEYSAATLYALPLLVETNCVQGASRTELEALAVEHLKRAMSSTPSPTPPSGATGFSARIPISMDCARARPSSTSRRSFPIAGAHSTAAAAGQPLGDVPLHQPAARGYRAAVESVWHQRRDLVVSDVDPHVVIQWSKDEAKAWQMVARMARDYKHWPARCDLIDEVKEWGARYGFEPLDVALPRFARDTEGDPDSPEAYRELCREVKAEVSVNERRLATLLGQLEPITGGGANGGGPASSSQANGTSRPELRPVPVAAATSGVATRNAREPRLWSRLTAPLRSGEPPVRQFERLQDELSDRDFWHRAAPVQFLQSVCDVHAAMWQRLHEWLEAPPDHRHADRDFSSAIAQAARLSETCGMRWMTAVVARRIQRLGAVDIDGDAHTMNGAPTLPA